MLMTIYSKWKTEADKSVEHNKIDLLFNQTATSMTPILKDAL